LWIYYNLFQPVMRTVEKTFVPVPGQRNKLKRRYDRPRTPFDRLCETSALSATRRSQLQALRDQINPLQLREDIYALIDYIFSLPSSSSKKFWYVGDEYSPTIIHRI
jgi:hypothetical protein